MFGYIKGMLAEIDEGSVTVDVNGIGIQILVGAGLIGRMPAMGSEVKIYTYTYVKEDAFSLFGFGSKEELELFKKLITVSGIGPKGGLALLSTLEPSEIRFAIYSADIKTISRVPGIGKKTAERLILELKDKISLDMPSGSEGVSLLAGNETAAAQDLMNNQKDAVEALVALGYSATEAARAVRECAPDESMSADEILKKSLRFLL
ncbi:MAG: Holliday junction branch migration protein RuvA [Lachnospiraceae bacterium]|nr:Holliday junction branch migration protein RuvA [Lachnospiraceae bacterium]